MLICIRLIWIIHIGPIYSSLPVLTLPILPALPRLLRLPVLFLPARSRLRPILPLPWLRRLPILTLLPR